MSSKRLYHCKFNTIQNKTQLDGQFDPFKVIPRAAILFTLNDTDELECSIHFWPAIEENDKPVPATHQMATYMYTAFTRALSGDINNE